MQQKCTPGAEAMEIDTLSAVLPLLGINLSLVLLLMLLLWLLSIPLRDVSFVDSFWAIGMVFVAAVTHLQTDGDPLRRLLLLSLTGIWGIRLGTYLFFRWRREGPDPRYERLLSKADGNRHLTSLQKIFLLQGCLLWLVSLPVQLGQSSDGTVGLLAAAGTGLALIGILFESIGDWQLARFKADSANIGLVMDSGLWRYTRHPNYFGDACVWWGLYLVAAETAAGRWGIVSPLLLTFILIKWSGAALLERRLKRSKPDYEAYAMRTSAFIPLPPRRVEHEDVN